MGLRNVHPYKSPHSHRHADVGARGEAEGRVSLLACLLKHSGALDPFDEKIPWSPTDSQKLIKLVANLGFSVDTDIISS